MRRTLRLVALLAALVVACGDGPTDATGLADEEDVMEVESVFADQEAIPALHTCDGDEVSPPLSISAIPDGTRTLVLIVEDPDAPSGTFDHWVAFDIEPTAEIPEGVTELGRSGRNSSGELGYTGPCPPSGTHRYYFRVYALDAELGIAEGASKEEVLAGAEEHVLAQGTLVGTYSR